MASYLDLRRDLSARCFEYGQQRRRGVRQRKLLQEEFRRLFQVGDRFLNGMALIDRANFRALRHNEVVFLVEYRDERAYSQCVASCRYQGRKNANAGSATIGGCLGPLLLADSAGNTNFVERNVRDRGQRVLDQSAAEGSSS